MPRKENEQACNATFEKYNRYRYLPQIVQALPLPLLGTKSSGTVLPVAPVATATFTKHKFIDLQKTNLPYSNIVKRSRAEIAGEC